MKNKKNYQLLLSIWIVALLIKCVGASWDASYHFKYLRETTQIAHIVNTIGFLIGLVTFFYMWKTRENWERSAIKVIGLGFLVFLLAIPFDEFWHHMFGLDLTTFSPPHMLLYVGTGIMIIGVFTHIRVSWNHGVVTERFFVWSQLILLSLFLENVWFPLLQLEQGVISYYLFEIGKPLASDEILALLVEPQSQIYGGIPMWLYAVYVSFFVMLLFVLVKRLSIHRFSCTYVAGLYVLFRVVMDVIYGSVAYPQSTVPYFLVVMALCFDVAWQEISSYLGRQVFSCMLTVGILYSVTLVSSTIPFHPPMPIEVIPFVVLAAFVGFSVGDGLWKMSRWKKGYVMKEVS
ncbi:hypothetical protein LCL95_00775 [Bacillus timonensis]|nr:hypothetical protein [Bacillus timonensis]